MSLPHGLLGLLSYQERTGYELTKIFEDSLNNFWHAQSSQIYRELGRMEEKAWVTSRMVPQEGRPNKRVYAITGEGLAALREWLARVPQTAENPHISMLMRVFFGAEAPEVTLGLLKNYRDGCLAAVETSPPHLKKVINGYAAGIADGEHKRLYWEMTLQYGVAQARMTAQWAQSCIELLEKGRQETEGVN